MCFTGFCLGLFPGLEALLGFVLCMVSSSAFVRVCRVSRFRFQGFLGSFGLTYLWQIRGIGLRAERVV